MEEIKRNKAQKREYWSTHINQWQESKLSQQAYCLQADIKLCTFIYWRQLLIEKVNKPKSFIPVKVAPSQPTSITCESPIHIKLSNGHLVIIPTTLDIKDITMLIKSLGEPHA